jgi:16S rRNA (cytidine1402-2'-O)-methyltransferase
VLAHAPRTLVFFEAPHRIVATLTDMVAEFGPARQAVVARELTKVHENLYRGTLEELITVSQRDENFARGEITLVVQGAPRGEEQSVDPALLLRTVDILLKELPPPRAAAVAAQLTGATRAAAYAMATRKKTDGG